MAKKTASGIDSKDYISAREAAHILTLSHGRRIDPSRINKLKNIRHIKINSTTFWYHRGDVEACKIRGRQTKQHNPY